MATSGSEAGAPAIHCYSCQGVFPLSQLPEEFNEEGQQCCPECGSEFVERLTRDSPAQGSATSSLATGIAPSATPQQPAVFNVGVPPLGPNVPRAIPFAMGPRFEIHAAFDHRPMLIPGGPLTFVDTISRFAPVSLPNGQQVYVLQVQDGALLSPFTMGAPFGEALALNPADWVVGDDLDAVVTRVLDAYMPPRRSTAQEVCDALPRLRVRPGPLSPRPTATLEEAAAAAAAAVAAAGSSQAGRTSAAAPSSGGGGAGVRVRLEPSGEGVRLRLLWPEVGSGGAPPAEQEEEEEAEEEESGPEDGAGAGSGSEDGYASCQPGELCTVCHDAFEAGGQVVELPCHHCFHEGCIMPWLQQQNTCPVCRKRLREAHGDGGQGGRTGAPLHLFNATSNAAAAARRHASQSPAAGTRAAAASGSNSPAAAAPGAVPAVPAQDSDAARAGPEGTHSLSSAVRATSSATPAAAAGTVDGASPQPAASTQAQPPSLGVAPAPTAPPRPPASESNPAAPTRGRSSGGVPLMNPMMNPMAFGMGNGPPATLTPEQRRQAEAALAPLRTRFPPLNLGPRVAPPGGGLEHLMAALAGASGPTRGSQPRPSSSSAAVAAAMGPGRVASASAAGGGGVGGLRQGPGSGPGSQGSGGAGQTGAAAAAPLRAGFFNQPVNLYSAGAVGGGLGAAASRGPAQSSTSGTGGAAGNTGTRSALRGGFFNTSASSSSSGGVGAGAGGATAGPNAGQPSAVGRTRATGFGAPVAGSSNSGGGGSGGVHEGPIPSSLRAQAPSGLGTRLPQRSAARPAAAEATKATAATPASSSSPVAAAATTTATAAINTTAPGAGSTATSGAAAKDKKQEEEGKEGRTRQVARRTLHEDAASLAHQREGGDGAELSSPRLGRTRGGGGAAAAAAASRAAKAAPAAAGDAAGGQPADPDAGADGRGRRVARVKVVRKGRAVAAAPRAASPAAAAAGGSGRRVAAAPAQRRPHSSGGASAAATGPAGRGAAGSSGGGGGGGFNPVSMVVGGAGAGLRFLGGMAAGLLRRGGGGNRRQGEAARGAANGGEQSAGAGDA